MMTILRRLHLAALLVTAVSAYRDDAFYANGTGNPNVNNPMYWRESYNVLQDLSQFESLYVQFYSCAWSAYVKSNGDDNNDDDDYYNGGNMDEYDTWYMGAVPPFVANVGFALYGTTKDSGRRDKGCSRGTFINSFVTTGGFDSFLNALALTGETDFVYQEQEGDRDRQQDGRPSSQCYAVDDGEHHDENDDYYGSFTDYFFDDSNNVKFYPDVTSTSVVCQGQSFVQVQFNSSVCDGSTVTSVTDSLEELNTNLQNAQCIRVYSASESDDDDENRDHDDETPVGRILGGSRACTIYDAYCPNPYGKLESYTRTLERAVGVARWSDVQEMEILATYVLGLTGLIMIVAAALLATDEGLQQWSIRKQRNLQEDPEELVRKAKQARLEADLAVKARRAREQADRDARLAKKKAISRRQAKRDAEERKREEEDRLAAEEDRLAAEEEEERLAQEQAEADAMAQSAAEQASLAREQAAREEQAEQERMAKAMLEEKDKADKARLAEEMEELQIRAEEARIAREMAQIAEMAEEERREARRQRRLAKQARLARQVSDFDDAASVASREIVLDTASYDLDLRRKQDRAARKAEAIARRAEAAAAEALRPRTPQQEAQEKVPRKRWFARDRFRSLRRKPPT